MNVSCTLTGPSSLAEQDEGIFVKKSARLILTDDLHVMSSLSAATSPLLTKSGVMNQDSKIEHLTFKLGVDGVIDAVCQFFSLVTSLTCFTLCCGF